MRFFCLSRIDLLTSTNSFIKRLVANFVGVNKIGIKRLDFKSKLFL
nr:MAG TPA: hypothetical protein [Caudoviricetes sp.]